METEQQQLESSNTTSPEGVLLLDSPANQNLPKLPPVNEPEAQWQRVARKTSEFLEQLPEYIGNFFDNYKQALTNVVLILAAIVTGKIVLTILDAINDIPLLEPIFELIGIIYATWFVFRYLIKYSTRQELAKEIQSLKQQIVGD
ncbi:CAAD domain-containing protein [Nostoc sp. CENA67]|uniref:CAAD domain-containing protein n=1 Tax=Amazonocrinis nigriterrae CENA67 TaxID=2794033 RepID=A0A8J7HYA2_9NOST|nr:CAAD domain-containing protein [Amazonocrinis nigriterrae]MBH8566490.1 CAAD domain-containing protein [Amazonocrinis nigriterrae CENA67]